MSVKIQTPSAVGKTTLVARAKRKSDSFYWNQTTSLWQAGDSSFPLTELASPFLGEYVSAALVGMGDADEVEITIHDTALSSRVVGGPFPIFVDSGDEWDQQRICEALQHLRNPVSLETLTATTGVAHIKNKAGTADSYTRATIHDPNQIPVQAAG